MDRPSEGLMGYQKITFYLLLVLKFPGLTEESPKILHLIWDFFSYFHVLLPLFMSWCNLMAVYERRMTESMDVLTHLLIQAVWLFSSFLIMFNFKLKSKKIKDMMDEMDETFMWQSPKGKTYITTEKCYKFARIISIFWQITPPSSVIADLIKSLFKRPIQLPAVDWFILDLNNTANFVLAYILQAWAHMIVVCCFTAGSTFFHTTCMLICGQFNIVKCSLKNITVIGGLHKTHPEILRDGSIVADLTEYLHDVEVEVGILPSKENLKDGSMLTEVDLTPSEVRNIRRVLLTCINHHILLWKMSTLLETYNNFFVLLRLLELTIQICIAVFILGKAPEPFLFALVVCSMFDLYILTYPADRVALQNNTTGMSLLMGPWYLISKHLKNEFLMILAYSHQPIRFTAGKILNLNSEKLRQVLQTAFSYYQLLSSFDDGKT